jgi:hypothetical protein
MGPQRNEGILEKLRLKPMIVCIQNYQRKWNTWAEWKQEESQNKFDVISQEGKTKQTPRWDWEDIWDSNRPPGVTLNSTKKNKKINYSHKQYNVRFANKTAWPVMCHYLMLSLDKTHREFLWTSFLVMCMVNTYFSPKFEMTRRCCI